MPYDILVESAAEFKTVRCTGGCTVGKAASELQC